MKKAEGLNRVPAAHETSQNARKDPIETLFHSLTWVYSNETIVCGLPLDISDWIAIFGLIFIG